MPSPTSGAVHVNTPLTKLSVAYLQKETTFVSDKVFPGVLVNKQSDRYYVYDKGDLLRDEAKVRAPGTESEGSGYELDNTPTYYCPVIAIHKDIPAQIRANADSVLDMDKDAMEFVSQKLLMKREIDWAFKYFKAGVWTTNYTGVAAGPAANQFIQFDAASSDPGTTVDVVKGEVKLLTGRDPNCLTVGRQVHDILKRHSVIRDQFKYTGSQSITKEMLAKYFEVDKYLVADAIYNTAAQGVAASLSYICGKGMLLSYAPANAGLLTPSAGYTFKWRGEKNTMPAGIRIKKFARIAEIGGDRVEGEMSYDQKVIGVDLAGFCAAAIS